MGVDSRFSPGGSPEEWKGITRVFRGIGFKARGIEQRDSLIYSAYGYYPVHVFYPQLGQLRSSEYSLELPFLDVSELGAVRDTLQGKRFILYGFFSLRADPVPFDLNFLAGLALGNDILRRPDIYLVGHRESDSEYKTDWTWLFVGTSSEERFNKVVLFRSDPYERSLSFRHYSWLSYKELMSRLGIADRVLLFRLLPFMQNYQALSYILSEPSGAIGRLLTAGVAGDLLSRLRWIHGMPEGFPLLLDWARFAFEGEPGIGIKGMSFGEEGEVSHWIFGTGGVYVRRDFAETLRAHHM